MAPTFDRPNFDSLTTSLCRAAVQPFHEQADSLESLQNGVRRVSHMVGVSMLASPKNITTGWASLDWSMGMASLAWLMEHRYLQLDSLQHSHWQHQECLRLRAMVAILWWQGGGAEKLQAFGLSDVDALRKKHDAWLGSLGSMAQPLPALLLRGPGHAICCWLNAAQITEGNVLRRISPRGKVAPGGLSSVGIYSILTTLLAHALEVGLVNLKFVLNFSKNLPIYPEGDSDRASEPSASAANVAPNSDATLRSES